MRLPGFSLGLAVFAFGLMVAGSVAQLPDPTNPDPDAPRPIAAVDSVFIEELTWMEVRDALREGTDTAIVAMGGVEQNGPYLVTGKHNVILRATTETIARRQGKVLVAPIVPFVPEGGFDPPSGHMRYPGTIGVTEDTFERLLSDICTSLRTHGFRHIVLIGDSGGNVTGMNNVANRLHAASGHITIPAGAKPAAGSSSKAFRRFRRVYMTVFPRRQR